MKEAKQILEFQPSSERLLQIYNNIKKIIEIGIEDIVVLSRICLSIGDTKFYEGNYIEAEIFYKEALSYGKGGEEEKIVEICLYELGAALGMQGRHRDGLNYFDEVIKRNDKNADAWNNKGIAMRNIGKNEEAVKCYDEAIRINT